MALLQLTPVHLYNNIRHYFHKRCEESSVIVAKLQSYIIVVTAYAYTFLDCVFSYDVNLSESGALGVNLGLIGCRLLFLSTD